MKYLVKYTIIFSILILNIYGDEDISSNTNIVVIRNLSFEQQEEAIKMREELLEEFTEIRSQLISIRTETQIEMRKENPNWNEIKRLNKEYSQLQKALSEGLLEYKEKMETIQLELDE